MQGEENRARRKEEQDLGEVKYGGVEDNEGRKRKFLINAGV